MYLSGPDIAEIQCYTPDGCCAPSVCAITEEQFVCQIRQLLPEGDIYNTTVDPTPPTPPISGAATVGCTTVGLDQLVFGGCCDPGAIPCEFEPHAPQLAVLDSFSTVAYQAVQALCQMLRELNPCTADLTLQRWAERFGITYPDPCEGWWSDHALSVLLCTMLEIQQHVINFDYLQKLAARFGAGIVMHYAGDMNCGPLGWWTMARTMEDCVQGPRPAGRIMRLMPPCDSIPLSLNLVVCPTDITFQPNCNLPPTQTLPHDPELYLAFKWLLPKILPQQAFWCVYECDPANCIV